MTATLRIDEAGKLELPKEICEHLHLFPGVTLKAKVVGDKLELSEAEPVGKIVMQSDGFPAIVGWEGFDASVAVREARERQLERL